jgi:hypothetical protein
MLGSTTDLAADASGNSVVDADDYAIWKQHYGNTTIPLTSVPPPDEVVEAALDAALAMFLSPENQPEPGQLAGGASSGMHGHSENDANAELLLAHPPVEDVTDPPRVNSRKSAIDAFGEWGKAGREWSLTDGNLEGLDEC